MSLRRDGYPSDDNGVGVMCPGSSQPVFLSYKDFIPGEGRRAIVDWEWRDQTSSTDIVSCIDDLRRGFPVAKSPDEEVYVFGILTYDKEFTSWDDAFESWL